METVFATPPRGKREGSLPASPITQRVPPAPSVTQRVPPAPAVPQWVPPASAGETSEIPAGLLPPSLTAHLEDTLRRHRSEAARGGGWEGSPPPFRGVLEEIRLRAGRCATLTVGGETVLTSVILPSSEVETILTHLCGGSLYAHSQTIGEGYILLPHGVRVGVSGRAVCEEGKLLGVREVTGLCIRLPHRHRGVGGPVCRLLRAMAAEGGAPRGVLIYAPPGVGKTTLLRGVAATMASGPHPLRTVVVDTRGELGFELEDPTLTLDVLTGYPRARGVEIATRTLSAQLMVCDEIGDVEEAMALLSAHNGGVPLVASAHGGEVAELLRRPGLRLLHEARLFGAYVGIRRDGRGDFIYRVTPWSEAEGREEADRDL